MRWLLFVLLFPLCANAADYKYRTYKKEYKPTKLKATVVLRFMTKEQLNRIWDSRSFLNFYASTTESKSGSNVHAFVIREPNGTCNVYVPKPKGNGWNDEHMLREIGHEVSHCFGARHE